MGHKVSIILTLCEAEAVSALLAFCVQHGMHVGDAIDMRATRRAERKITDAVLQAQRPPTVKKEFDDDENSSGT